MKTNRMMWSGLAALTMCIAACSNPAQPAGSVSTQPTTETTSGSKLAVIQPRLGIVQTGSDTYSLYFAANANGGSDSPQMIALRSIEDVRFDVYSPAKELLYSRSTQEITKSGIAANDVGVASMTASARVDWQHEQPMVPGSYAVMTISATDDHAVVTERFPTKD